MNPTLKEAAVTSKAHVQGFLTAYNLTTQPNQFRLRNANLHFRIKAT
jgi:hypothetical protein